MEAGSGSDGNDSDARHRSAGKQRTAAQRTRVRRRRSKRTTHRAHQPRAPTRTRRQHLRRARVLARHIHAAPLQRPHPQQDPHRTNNQRYRALLAALPRTPRHRVAQEHHRRLHPRTLRGLRRRRTDHGRADGRHRRDREHRDQARSARVDRRPRAAQQPRQPIRLRTTQTRRGVGSGQPAISGARPRRGVRHQRARTQRHQDIVRRSGGLWAVAAQQHPRLLNGQELRRPLRHGHRDPRRRDVPDAVSQRNHHPGRPQAPRLGRAAQPRTHHARQNR